MPPFISKAMIMAAAAGGGIDESIPAGASATFNSNFYANDGYTVSCDPNNANKFVVVYRDYSNSSKGTACVGTISDTSISFGSEYVFNTGYTYEPSVAFDPNNSGKFVVVYKDSGNSEYGTACVGTVSGTTITYGSEYVFNSGVSDPIGNIAFDPNDSGKFVVVYRDRGNSSYGTAIVGTVSGTAISYGTAVVYNTAETNYTYVAFDPNTSGKFVVTYRDDGNSDYGTACVGTVSGTSISFGSEYVFNSGASGYNKIDFDPNDSDKFVVAYRDGGNSNYGTAIVGTISGTAISYGSEYVFNSSDQHYFGVACDPNNSGKFIVAYKDYGNPYYGTVIVGTVSGTTITYGSEYTFDGSDHNFMSVAFESNSSGKFVVVYRDATDSGKGKAILGQIGT